MSYRVSSRKAGIQSRTRLLARSLRLPPACEGKMENVAEFHGNQENIR